MDSDTLAQFCAVTSAEVPTAQQYLSATDGNLEQAVELFFATGGVSASAQSDALEAPSDVRERIEGTTDQIMDAEAQYTNEMIRESRRAHHAARRPRGIFNQSRDTDVGEGLTPHEQRLAELFRPPFDIIRDIMLDDAKEEAQIENKWIMVNIQDPAEFSCQRLNRDLWRNEMVKDVIRENFLFLQYDEDSPDGEDYRVLYPFEEFPHIAIVDPWTGEQQRAWTKVPDENDFLNDITQFVASFGQPRVLDSPAAEEAPSLLHEESLGETTKTSTTSSEPAVAAQTENVSAEAQEGLEQDPTSAIAAKDIQEPATGPDTTRIQLRFGDGRRVVRRFNLTDPVADVYAYVKHANPELQGIPLSLTSERRDLVAELGKSIQDANLKNSTVLVEAR